MESKLISAYGTDSILLTVIFICLFFWIHKQRNGIVSKFPPGPFQLPFIGNWLEFRRSPLKALLKWKAQYGQIVGLKIGSYRVVLLSDVEILKQAFRNVNFVARPELMPIVVFAGGLNRGTITSTSYQNWEAIRNLTIKVLAEVGFAPRPDNDLMTERIVGMIQRLKRNLQNGDSLVCMRDAVMVPITQYVWHILSGENLDLESSIKLQKQVLDFQNKFYLHIGSPFWMSRELVQYFPTLTGYNDAQEAADVLHKILQNAVNDIKRDLDLEEGHPLATTVETYRNPKNFIRAWLLRVQQNNVNLLPCLCDEEGEGNLIGTMMNVFTTGVSVFANTLNWALAFMAARPDVQQRLRDEIQEITGKRNPLPINLSDFNRMDYFRAFTKEVFRVSSSAPFANFHQATSDVVFRGFEIPTGTVLIGNLYAANHDPELWGDPERFRPERFLGEEANYVPPSLPFSVGLRTCLGQAYTRSAFFLYIATILVNFKLTFDPSLGPLTELDIQNQALVSVFRIAKPYVFELKTIE